MADGITYENGMVYGTQKDGSAGTYKPQLIPFYWQRKALIDLRKDMYFGQLADTTSMPK